MAQDEAVEVRGHRLTNQIAGLLVFALGIILLVMVFMWARDMYRSIDARAFAAQPVTSQPQVKGTPPSQPLPPGALKAKPQPTAALTPVAMGLLVQVLALIIMGWVGALIAGKGITLAVAVPRRE